MASSKGFSGTSLITGVTQLSRMTRGYAMIKENLIRAVKLGRKTYIDWHSVERLFESLPEIVPKTQTSY
jgi:hypothetical protein